MPLLLLAALALGQSSDSPRALAMVLLSKGANTLERGKKDAVPLGAMTLVLEGDRLRAADQGEIVLVFPDSGRYERVKPGAAATVGIKGCAPAEAIDALKAKLPRENYRTLKDLIVSSKGAVGVLRSDDLPAQVPVCSPIYGAEVLTDRPTLTWRAAPKADRYQLVLLSGAEGASERVIFRATVKEPRLAFPEKEKPLTFGNKYRWRVLAGAGEDEPKAIVESKFFVITKTEAKLLAALGPLAKNDDPADLLLAAATYEGHGVYDEALKLYERLAKMQPEEGNYWRALGNYYERAGHQDMAAKARERAKTLGVAIGRK